MIIDEWDAILREMGSDDYISTSYVDLLRRLFKGLWSDTVFAGAYLTGILPIKRYNTESALNNFCEYTMIRPGKMSEALGFTHDEVEMLCKKHGMDLMEMERWYDGYRIGKASRMFNPYSVIKAIYNEEYGSYWTTTGAYDSVITYIQMNFDGLKDDIIRMLSGESVYVNTTEFLNDMHNVRSKNDVLTVLIHLGYLSYNKDTYECYIPNKEVADEMNNAIRATSWTPLANTIQNSKFLLDATIAGNENAVAQVIDIAHDENTSILAYNGENSLHKPSKVPSSSDEGTFDFKYYNIYIPPLILLRLHNYHEIIPYYVSLYIECCGEKRRRQMPGNVPASASFGDAIALVEYYSVIQIETRFMSFSANG
ncbi:MAG: AAA family ATPase [Prevotella sp.]|nr:AAA family ATPase [Prevotella sp.]